MNLKLYGHPSLHRSPAPGHWRDHARELLHRMDLVRRPAPRDQPTSHSFDDSRHPVWAIASAITVFFLLASVLAFFVLLADALWTRT